SASAGLAPIFVAPCPARDPSPTAGSSTPWSSSSGRWTSVRPRTTTRCCGGTRARARSIVIPSCTPTSRSRRRRSRRNGDAMAEPHELRCYDYVNHPYVAVRDALQKDLGGIFERATKGAAGRAEALAATLKVEVGALEIGTDVTIEVVKVEERPEG